MDDAAPNDVSRVGVPARAPSTERFEALEVRLRELESRPPGAAASAASESALMPERVVDRVDALVDRIDTVSETARSAASGLVARERELETIRRDLADTKATVEVAISDFRRRVDPASVDHIQRSIADVADRLAGAEERQRELAERLEALADAAAADRSTITSHERALGELSGSLDATGERMDSVVATVRQAVESLLAQVGSGDGSGNQEGDGRLESRLDALERRVEGLDAQPRLVTWGSRSVAADDEHAPSGDGRSEPHPYEGSDLTSDEERSDTRGPIVSFGGGA